MKKSFLLALFLSLILIQTHSLEARVEVDEARDYVVDDRAVLEPTRPEDFRIPSPADLGAGETTLCEIDSKQIDAIRFYADHCLNRRDEGYLDVDLNLQCLMNAPVYRSYCREENYSCFGGGRDAEGNIIIPICIRLLSENAQTCLARLHCARGTPTPMPPMPPAADVTVTAISPNSAQEGSAAFTLTVTGTNFTSGSLVLWNGRNKATTYVSATELHAQIDASDIAHAGSIPVTVMTGARVSSGVNFTITAAPARRDMGVTPPPSGSRTSPETVINPTTGTDTSGFGTGSEGGCALSFGTSESMSFGIVAMSFVMGSFLMLRRKKH